jgi:integrase
MTRGNIRQRSAGSWTIAASGGFDDTGKRVRISRTVRGARRDAEKALTKLLREVDTGTATTDGSITLGRYLEGVWLPHMRTRVRPKSWARYEGLTRLHWVPGAGRVTFAKLRPRHLQAVIDKMISDGAAPASVLKAHRMISQALAQAVRWQMLAVNPAAAVRPPRVDRPALSVPDAGKVRDLLSAAEGTPYHTPLLLAAKTGARRGEILGIRWRDIDLDR